MEVKVQIHRTPSCLLRRFSFSKFSFFCAFFFLFIGKEVGETVMYFGCRHKNEDYLYQEELEEAEKNAVLTQLNVAFSRDQEQKVELTHPF